MFGFFLLCFLGCFLFTIRRGTCTIPIVSRDDTESKYAQWQDMDIDNYDFTFGWNCYCFPCYTSPKVIKVRNGLISDVSFENPSDSEDASCGDNPNYFLDFDFFLTISQLFDIILDGIDTAYQTRVEFNDEYSYPEETYIDHYQMMADEETSWSITSFQDCNDEYIHISSLNSRNWNIDTSIYVGNYYYSGHEHNSIYPIYVLENEMADIRVRESVSDPTELEIVIRLWDENDPTTSIAEFVAGGRDPTNNDDGYIELSQGRRQPFNCRDQNRPRRWRSDQSPYYIVTTSHFYDTCSQLGFDLNC